MLFRSSGGTVLNDGTLALGVNNTLLAGGSVSVTGGELSLGTTSQTVGAVSLTGGLISGSTLTGTSYTVENGVISAILAGAGVVLTKNNAGTVLNWLNNASSVIGWTYSSGYALYKSDAQQFGKYLGYTLTSTDPGFTINTLELE